MQVFPKILHTLWYGFGLFLALAYLEYYLAGTAAEYWLWMAKAIIGFLLLACLFVLIPMAFQTGWQRLSSEGGSASEGIEVFPSPTTVAVGSWLLFMTLMFLAAFFLTVNPPQGWLKEWMGQDGGTRDALVSMLAAGVGSSVSTILAYLEFVRTGFIRVYVPWYLVRPVLGMLLGLIFFFVLKGGLLAAVPADSAANASDLNHWALAGMGALVGLFSKPALEKLREIFDTLFKTEHEMNQGLLERLPEDLKDQVEPYLSSSKYKLG